jgi:hypothetical protein
VARSHLETPCGGRLISGPNAILCEGFGVTDPSRNGIYTIRVSDDRGLRRITFNRGGDAIPGDFSPDGTRLVFGRIDPSRPAKANVALFVVNVDRTGLRRTTLWGLPFFEYAGRWSPDGKTILFDDQKSLYVVHPDGSGLAKIPLATRSFSRLQNPTGRPKARTSSFRSSRQLRRAPGRWVSTPPTQMGATSNESCSRLWAQVIERCGRPEGQRVGHTNRHKLRGGVGLRETAPRQARAGVWRLLAHLECHV